MIFRQQIVYFKSKFLLLTWLDLCFRIGCFDGGGYHGDEPTLGGHLMSVADHRHVDVRVAANLRI